MSDWSVGSVEVEIRSRPPGPVLDPRPVADWRPRVRVGHTHSPGAGGTQLARANDMSFYCYTKLPNLDTLCPWLQNRFLFPSINSIASFQIQFNSSDSIPNRENVTSDQLCFEGSWSRLHCHDKVMKIQNMWLLPE